MKWLPSMFHFIVMYICILECSLVYKTLVHIIYRNSAPAVQLGGFTLLTNHQLNLLNSLSQVGWRNGE